MRTGVALIGSPSFVWQRQDALFDSALVREAIAKGKPLTFAGAVIGKAGVVPIPLPVPDGKMIASRAIPGTLRTAQVVWGESALRAPDPFDVQRVWYASYDGAQWTKPELILGGRYINWTPISSSVIAVHGQPWIVVPGVDTTGARAESGLFLAQRSDQGWRTTHLGMRGLSPAAASVAPVPGAAAVAFIGSVQPKESGIVNGIFISRYTPMSDQWERPALIASFGDRQGADPRLIADSAGRNLTLVWRSASTASKPDDSLHAAISVDGGRTWSSPSSAGYSGRLYGLRAAVDARGDVDVFALDRDGSRLVRGSFRHGRWTEVLAMKLGSAMTGPAFVQLRDSALATGERDLLLWGDGAPGAADDHDAGRPVIAPTLRLAIRAKQCVGR